MECSLDICNFLEEISSLSHSVVFLYFFALIAEEGFLISPCYSMYSLWGCKESDMTEVTQQQQQQQQQQQKSLQEK